MHFPSKIHRFNLTINQFTMFILVFPFIFLNVKAQSPSSMDDLPSQNAVTNFQASLAVVICILSLMFFLTFILLVYAKFCRRAAFSSHNNQQFIRSASCSSGIDKTVIESLPFFRFSSLKGSREGLECAVCLCKFEDIEVLRLLPKCKHAFHIACVDQWLEKHSSCPLCRQKVNADDLTLFANSTSLRLGDESNLGIFIQREESSRFSSGGSFRRSEKGKKKEEEMPIQESFEENDEEILHKFNHRIIVSDSVLKNRWSSVSSSDLMFLNSEMVNDASSNRFSSLDPNKEKFATKNLIEDDEIVQIKEEMDRKRVFESKLSKINQSDTIPFSGTHGTSTSNVLNPTAKRSMSEITVHPRFKEFGIIDSTTRDSSVPENDFKEERMRRLWLPIAGRTVQWFASREIRSLESHNTRKPSNV